jgi:hypothetical protein
MATQTYRQGDGEHALLKKILARLEEMSGLGSGGGGPISTAGSITQDGSNTISLVGDSDTPGNRKYYGTNGSGTKGFFPISVTVFDASVNAWADLPTSLVTAPQGSLYVVRTSSGTWFVDRKEAGSWYRSGSAGVSADWVRLGNFDEMMIDDNLRIRDNSDLSKEIAFQLSGISTGTTRVVTFQDRDGTLAYLDDLTGFQAASVELSAIAAITSTGVLSRDGTGLWSTLSLAAVATSGLASDVSFDNAISGLTGDDVQSAIDELAARPFSSFDGAFSSLTGTPTTLSGYGITDAQPLDSDLTAIAGLATDAFGRALLTKTDAASIRSYIGAGTSSFSGAFSALTGTPTTLTGYGITDAQPLDSDLTAIAGLATDAFGRDLLTKASAAGVRLYIGAGTSSFDGAFSSLTGTPTTLSGYGITDAQPIDSDLTAIAALATDAFGRGLLIKTDAASVRTYIGAGTSSFSGAFSALSGIPTTLSGYGITDAQPLDGDLTAIAALTTDAFGRGLLIKTDAASVRTYIGAGTSSFSGAFSALSGIPTTLSGYGITDAQPLDSDLTAIAALTTTSFGRSLLTQADAAATRSTIGAGTSSFSGAFSALTGIPTTRSGYGITDAAANGAVTASGITMATSRILGRTTASTGAIEELTAGTSLSLASGSLNTIQGIRTTDTPRFARLGLGVAAHATTPLKIFGGNATADIPFFNFEWTDNVSGATPVFEIGATTNPLAGDFTAVYFSVFDNSNGEGDCYVFKSSGGTGKQAYIDTQLSGFLFGPGTGTSIVGLQQSGFTDIVLNGTSVRFALNTGSTEFGRFTSNRNLLIGTTADATGGVGCVGIGNANTVPTSNPSAGGILYVQSGALKYRGSSGTITTIANA